MLEPLCGDSASNCLSAGSCRELRMAMASASLSLRALTMIVGAGYGGTYLYNNVTPESVRGLVADLVLRDSRSGSNRSADGRGPHDVADSGAVDAIAAQVERLSREVQRSSARPVVVYGGNDSFTSSIVDKLALAGWAISIVSVGTGVAYFCYWRGYSFRDLLWVSRSTFNTTVDCITSGVKQLSASVASVRRDLTDKLLSLEYRVENVQVGLENKIESEVADVKNSVEGVGHDVEIVHNLLSGVNDRIELLDGKLDTATSGILALVRVVSSLAPDKVSRDSPFVDLRRFQQLATADKPGHLPSSKSASFAPHQLPSSFAAAALEGVTRNGDAKKPYSSAPFISRRHSMSSSRGPAADTAS